MAKDISAAVRKVCLSFPEAEEVVSHGSPNFRVRGKTFASWDRVAALVRQAYEKVAPRALADAIGATVSIKSPPASMAPDEVDPLKSRKAQALLKRLRTMYLSWPEVSEDLQFGSPVWRAGKKTFAWVHADRNAKAEYARGSEQRSTRTGESPGAATKPARTRRRGPRLQLYFWVGVAAQCLMTTDERFEIPAYVGHKGWISLDVTDHCDWKEVRGLALASYRHFALQRMLKALGEHSDLWRPS